ncbi:MAG: sulfatase [Actinomycetes bacterium]
MKRSSRKHRGRFLIALAAAAFGIATLAALPQEGHAAASSGYGETPDIVIILTDDQRVGLLDAMPTVRNSIIAQGVNYTQAMVPTSVCCPSRASILTGMYSHSTGVWHNGDKTAISGVPGGYDAFVANGNESRTVAVALDQAGYQTEMIGKYLNGYLQQYGPPPGWDRFLAFDKEAAYYDYMLGGQLHGSRARDYSTDVIARKAVTLIQTAPTAQPLFMYIAPKAPHAPFIPAPRDVGAPMDQYVHPRDFGAFNEANLSDKPAWLQNKSPVSVQRMHELARAQHRSLLAVDELTGNVIDALKARGTLSNTLLIFMSDNGLQWGEHRLTKKDLPYTASTRIPMAMRWDGHIAPGTTRTDLVLNVDIAPTIADVVGVTMPGTEGFSLLSPNQRTGFPIEGTIGKPLDHGTVQRPAYCGWRTATQLFVHYSGGQEELYLLDQDPNETHNVASDTVFESVLNDLRNQTQQKCAPVPPMFSWQSTN